MRDQSSHLQQQDRKAYAEQVHPQHAIILVPTFPVLTLLPTTPQVAMAFYKAIGGASDDDESEP